MASWYTTQDDDVLDAICHRFYPTYTHDALDYVLTHDYNQGLAELGAHYEAGVKIFLPDLPNEFLIPVKERKVKLFDD